MVQTPLYFPHTCMRGKWVQRKHVRSDASRETCKSRAGEEHPGSDLRRLRTRIYFPTTRKSYCRHQSLKKLYQQSKKHCPRNEALIEIRIKKPKMSHASACQAQCPDPCPKCPVSERCASCPKCPMPSVPTRAQDAQRPNGVRRAPLNYSVRTYQSVRA